MSTTKPRITITLEEITALQLRRISQLTGNSQSALVSEVLAEAEPVFDRLIKVLEAAEKAKAQLSAQSMQNLEAAQIRIEKQLGLALGDFEASTAPLLEEAEKVRRRARKGAPRAGKGVAPAAAPTPLSNRGVRSTPDNREKSRRKARDAQI